MFYDQEPFGFGPFFNTERGEHTLISLRESAPLFLSGSFHSHIMDYLNIRFVTFSNAKTKRAPRSTVK